LSENSEKEQKSLITQIDDDECGVYEIHMESLYYKGIGDNIVGGEVVERRGLWANLEGQNIIYKLFTIVKDELGPIVDNMNTPKDIFARTSYFLFNRFVGNERKIKGYELESAIKDKIEELKENKFIIGLDEEFNFIKVQLEDIMNMFLTLREQKIQFHEEILAEYQKRKQVYNKDLRIQD